MENTQREVTPPPFEGAEGSLGGEASAEAAENGAQAPAEAQEAPAEGGGAAAEVGMYQSEAIEAAAQAGGTDAGDCPFFLANLRPGFWD